MNVSIANMWYNKFKFTIRFLQILLAAAGLTLAGLILTVRPGGMITIFFYLTIALFSLSFWTLLGFYARKGLGQREFGEYYLSIAARQALWLTLILIFSLLLSSFGFFSWLNALFLIFVFVFLESYLITKQN